ncbi:unnamed protein product [Closterium sp. Yama58-4]|nr:unnamed protein product [Closterium sp. Yama58-4]
MVSMSLSMHPCLILLPPFPSPTSVSILPPTLSSSLHHRRLLELIPEATQMLLELIPEAKQMFSMTRRAKEPHRENKLLQAHATTAMRMVCAAAVKLDKQKEVRSLKTTLADLGSRHLLFGVTSEHAPKLRAAFVAVLSDALGDEWGGDVEQAWVAAYNAIEYMFLVGFLVAKHKFSKL